MENWILGGIALIIMGATVSWMMLSINMKIKNLRDIVRHLSDDINVVREASNEANDTIEDFGTKVVLFQKAVDSVFAEEVVLTKGINSTNDKLFEFCRQASEVRLAQKRVEEINGSIESRNQMITEQLKGVEGRLDKLEKGVNISPIITHEEIEKIDGDYGKI